MPLRPFRRFPAAGRLAALCRSSVLRRVARPAGTVALLAFSAVQVPMASSAQYYGAYDPCNPCQVVCQPVCHQMAMVVQPAYQTVQVVEQQQVTQTVMKPVTETKYVDQQVTTYRPVTETKTAQVPVTTYHPVTEMQTVYQDRSYYATQYVPNCRVSPCQYDPRPGLMGWMNRTGYEIRSAFTPRYTAYRHYVPNHVAMQVPVTRQVAQQGTRQVTYNVTRYEPHTETRRVAVNETRWVAEQQTVTKPVVAYRTVPVGTTVAYASTGSSVAYGGGTISNVAYGPIQYNGATATAFGPTPDPVSAQGTTTVPSRSASNTPDPGKPGDGYKRSNSESDSDFGDAPGTTSSPRLPRFHKFSDADRERILQTRRMARNRPTSEEPNELAAVREALKPHADHGLQDSALAVAFERPGTHVPLAIRSIRWTTDEPAGPSLFAPTLAATN